MIITAHIVSGGVVGELINNPVGAFVIGFILHFLLDATPHFDVTDDGRWTRRQIIWTSVDLLLSLAAVLFLFKLPFNQTLFTHSVAWGVFGNFLPDLVDNVPLWSKQFGATCYGAAFRRFHNGIHKKQPSWPIGMLTQIGFLTICLYLHFVVVK